MRKNKNVSITVYQQKYFQAKRGWWAVKCEGSLLSEKQSMNVPVVDIGPVNVCMGYLEEFTFRFNRRRSRSRGLIFRRLLEHAVATVPVTEHGVTD